MPAQGRHYPLGGRIDPKPKMYKEKSKLCGQKIRIVVDGEGSFVLAHTTNGNPQDGKICDNLAGA